MTAQPIASDTLAAETSAPARQGKQRPSVLRMTTAILIPVALLFSLVAWAFSSAVGSSPDEDYHLASIWCGQGAREGYCANGDAKDQMKVPERLLASSCYSFKPTHNGLCPTEDPTRLVETPRGNFHDHAYPEVYYAVMSIFVQHSVDASVLSMRIFNALVFVGMMTAAFLLHQKRRRGVVLWSALGVLVPFGMFIIPSVNPSSWAVTSAACLWLAVVGFYEASTRGRMIGFGVLALLATVIGAGARADAAMYAVLALAAVVVLKWRRAENFWLRSLLVVGVFVVCAAFFFASGQRGAITAGPPTPLTGEQTLELTVFDMMWLPWIWIANFGQAGLGWLDTVMPYLVWMPALTIAAGLAFHGLRFSPWRKSLAIAGVSLALIVIPLYMIVKDRVLMGEYVQPRYIFPMVIIFAGLCLWGLRGLNISLSGAQLCLIALALTLANSLALHANTRRYTAGVSVEGIDLNKELGWWWHLPIGPNWMFAAGTLAFFITVAAAAITAWPRWAAPSTGSGLTRRALARI